MQGTHYHHRRKKSRPTSPWIDRAIYGIAFIGPLVTFEQVLKIYLYQNAQGISLLTWTVYFVCSLFWIVYGYIHKEKVIIIANSLFFLFNGLVVIGTILYG